VLAVAAVAALSMAFAASGRYPDGTAGPPGDGPAASRTAAFPGEEAAATTPVLPAEYPLGVSFGDIGPRLLAVGAIDLDEFVHLYSQRGSPLTAGQMTVLTEGSDAEIVINRQNANFLLNFFWAFGLTNLNPLLDEGPMMDHSDGRIGRFASTGGWTLGTRQAEDLYSSEPIVSLTSDQQARLEEVASSVYRPCCNNPTSFPDCNHGMAMLGILELLASTDATEEEMYVAAKHINSLWFPQQAIETAMFFEHSRGLEFPEIPGRDFVGADTFSATGFQRIHEWLAGKDLLRLVPGSGSSCAV
jgi:hypothetical protein